MTPFIVKNPSGHATPSSEGVVAQRQYEGPHGPVFAAHSDDGLTTLAWGPKVASAHLDFGPSGRRDGRRHTSFVDPVGLMVGTYQGEAVRQHSAVFSRRRRGIVIRLGPRSYLYRVTGYAREMLERGDQTPVASLGGVFGANKIAETVDAFDVVLALVMFYAVPVTAII